MGRKGCAQKSSNFVCFFFAMLLPAWFIMFTGTAYALPYYIPLPSGPRDVAVNPDTGKIYVATGVDVTVIDGTDNSAISAAPVARYNNLAVDRSTNKIYAASEDNGVSVAVIDGDDESFNLMANIGTAGCKPVAMALSERDNKVYLVYQDLSGAGKMAVIHGATQTVEASVYATIDVGTYPSAIAVNETAGRVYIANSESADSEGGSVTVVDAVYNAVMAAIPVGCKPVDICINEKTDKIYVANYGTDGSTGTVSVIDGGQNTVTAAVYVGINPCSLDINRNTDMIYVSNAGYYRSPNSTAYVTSISGKDNTTEPTILNTTIIPGKIIVNEKSNEVYVANNVERVYIIDGENNDISFVKMKRDQNIKRYMAFDSSSGRIYVTCGFGNNPTEYKLAVIDPMALTDAATNGDGTAVVLEFGRRMADPSGKHGQFEALIDGEIRSFSAARLHPGDDTRIDLLLDGGPITRENAVKISYREGDVRCKAGHALKSFHDAAVTNKVVGFDISAPQNVKAGVTFNITITAKDFSDYPPIQALNYNGTKILTYDGPGIAPGGQAPSYTNEVTFNDSGYSFGIPITLFRAETTTLTVYDAGATGNTIISVEPADISSFEATIQTEGNPAAGIPFGVMLKAVDAYGNLATAYNGVHKISFTWNAPDSPDGAKPVKPADGDVEFTDGIAVVEGFIPTGAEERVVVTAADESSHRGRTSLAVEPGTAASLTIAAPQEASAGGEFAGRLVVKDAFGNVAAGYAGTVRMTCTDGKAAFRQDYAFTSADGGIKDFKMTMKTAGTHTIAVQDTKTQILSAACTISVNPGPIDRQKSEVAAYPDHLPADGMTSSAVTVILRDGCDNALSGHVVALRQNGGSSQITPAEGVSGNDGKVEFAVSDNKAEAITYTAIDVTGQDVVVGSARVLFDSTDASLEGISLSSGSLTPGFDPGIYRYTVDVADSVESITVMPATQDDNSSIAVNGILAVDGQASDPINLAPGNNIITITVTAQDGITTKTYTITVIRANPSGGNDAGDDTEGRGRRHASKSIDSSAIIQATVDPAVDSTLENYDRTIRLDFPRGFMTVPAGASLRVAVKEIAGEDLEDLIRSAIRPEGFKCAVKALELTAEMVTPEESVPVLSFDKPVTLTVRLGGRDIQGAEDPGKLGAFKVEADGSLSFAGGKIMNDVLVADIYGSGRYFLAEIDITFEDIKGHWAEEDIELMASKLVVRGFPGGNFEPEGGVTRAQFAAMLVRAMGLSVEKQGMSFADVKPGDWRRDELQAAITAGIVTGFDGGSFDPEAPITREQAAVMMMRALKAGGAKRQNSAPEVSAVSIFADTEKISPWARDDLAAAVERGILKGLSAGTLGPRSQVTRAQAAVMIARWWRQF